MSERPFLLTLDINDRALFRAMLFGAFAQDPCGNGTDRTRSTYYVETLSDGKRIFLRRPAPLNKGVDFIIWCEGYKPPNRKRVFPPRHTDLFYELIDIAGSSSGHKTEILDAISKVYNCQSIPTVLNQLVLLKGNIQAERVLKMAKWMFIEQDVTAWNYSGRAKLMDGITQAFANVSFLYDKPIVVTTSIP